MLSKPVIPRDAAYTAAVLFSLLFFAAPASAQRLAGTVIPEHYSLWFAPDLQRATFRGRETIDVTLREPSSSITLHAAEISFGEVTIAAGGQKQVARVTSDSKAETATLTVPMAIPAGRASIAIDYTGVLNDKLRGFYLSSGNGRKYAVTQLEATDARRAFPSFDEPIYKATFEVSLMIDNGDTAISNGRQRSDTPGPEAGKHTLAFERTPKMSTYLVAMVVGDFVCRDGSSAGTPIRVCSTPDKKELTGFALAAAEQQLAFFNDYFGITYPFGKLDIIGIPDFAAGAMENVGAITFRERLLLVDEQRASIGVRKNVASIISHEIAHMWFGNLVTMKWWDDIWLNEGFATWAATKPLAAWKPEWHVELLDADGTQDALGVDALRSTRAIRTRVETPAEINEVFDPIAYDKTASVLRMIEAYVGPDQFRKGVASYLKRYAYSNAAGEDFWNEVTSVTGKPVDRILRSFVDQAGAPVLSVRTTPSPNGIDVSITQERFVSAPGATAPAPQVWTIPVCVKTTDGEPQCESIDQRERRFTVARSGGVPFVNANSRGYYLSEYSPGAVRALSTAGLAPVERLSLLGDEWRMMRAFRHEIGTYLDLSGSLANDETAEITASIGSRLAYVNDNLVDAAERSRYQTWIRQQFGPALRALGLPGNATDSDDKQSRRAALLSLVAISGGDLEIRQVARDLAEKYVANPSSLSGSLAPTVLNVAAVSGDAALYDQYLAKVRSLAAQPEEFYRFFNALPWFSDPALVKRTLDFALTSEVRSQDTSVLIGRLMSHPWGKRAAWEFTKTHWKTLSDKLGTFQGIPGIISSLGSFCSTREAAEVRQFFAKNPVPSSERAIRQVIEQIETCAELDAKQSPALSRWLK